MPELGPITRRTAVGGQIAYSVEVTYPDERPTTIVFVSSVYGGPVTMITANGQQTFVTEPARFGKFGPSWVRQFFGRES